MNAKEYQGNNVVKTTGVFLKNLVRKIWPNKYCGKIPLKSRGGGVSFRPCRFFNLLNGQ